MHARWNKSSCCCFPPHCFDASRVLSEESHNVVNGFDIKESCHITRNIFGLPKTKIYNSSGTLEKLLLRDVLQLFWISS